MHWPPFRKARSSDRRGASFIAQVCIRATHVEPLVRRRAPHVAAAMAAAPKFAGRQGDQPQDLFRLSNGRHCGQRGVLTLHRTGPNRKNRKVCFNMCKIRVGGRARHERPPYWPAGGSTMCICHPYWPAGGSTMCICHAMTQPLVSAGLHSLCYAISLTCCPQVRRRVMTCPRAPCIEHTRVVCVSV